MKRLSILGATGSIGTSALDIVRMHPERFQVKALTAANNLPLLCRQHIDKVPHFFQGIFIVYQDFLDTRVKEFSEKTHDAVVILVEQPDA